ncbi:MAG: hypothetical protein L3J39_01045 [Verrucomicrobiales bacterium]|nr:hypothetical protein [Verrucomicrobiales bacterium]
MCTPSIYLIALTCLSLPLTKLAAVEAVVIPSAAQQVEYVLTIVHPGDSTAKPTPHTLVQIRDEQGEPKAYSMWVDSVICREKTCDVVQVQLHWDALGRYQSYQVAFGSELTKLDHVPFTQEEKRKLHSILSDPNSPLKETEKEAMTAKIPTGSEANKKLPKGVAAISAPTVLTLKTAVILGAGYTCYDLWHWSNGLLTDRIRHFTAKDSSLKKILSYLSDEDDRNALFALQALRQRKISQQDVFKKVLTRSQQGSSDLMENTLAYLKENAPNTATYEQALIHLFAEANTKKRLFILEKLTAEAPATTGDFYDQLSNYLPQLASYFEAHLYFNLIEQNQARSALINKNAVQLLSHKKFFVSRRAYAYLKKQKLDKKFQKVVDEYQEKHKDRL